MRGAGVQRTCRGLRGPWVVSALLGLAACAQGGASSQGAGGTRAEAGAGQEEPLESGAAFGRTMLRVHNQVRAEARPTPVPPLPPLTWSEAAERTAQAWARQCDYQHNPQRGPFGENLAAASPGAMSTRQVVEGWASEAADYHPARNSCAPGKVCGHYTQLVWRDTRQLGCAVQRCTRNSPFGARFPVWDFWVCNYAPPGNVVGRRPY
jgi:pathogenesis-related protein 1